MDLKSQIQLLKAQAEQEQTAHIAQLQAAESQHRSELARKKEEIENLNTQLTQGQADHGESQPGTKVGEHNEFGVMTQMGDAESHDADKKSEECDGETQTQKEDRDGGSSLSKKSSASGIKTLPAMAESRDDHSE